MEFVLTATRARVFARELVSLTLYAVGCGAACSAGPQDASSEPPPESQLDPPTRASPGCRFAERPLGEDEAFETWPAPRRIAAAVNHGYVGPMRWLDADADARPGDEIEVAVELDAEHVTLRYPVSPARPNEPILCASSLIVPITARLRLGEAQAELSGLYVTYEELLGLSAALPEPFAATFAAANTDGYGAHLEIAFDGSTVAGRFELNKGGIVPRTAGDFVAD